MSERSAGRTSTAGKSGICTGVKSGSGHARPRQLAPGGCRDAWPASPRRARSSARTPTTTSASRTTTRGARPRRPGARSSSSFCAHEVRQLAARALAAVACPCATRLRCSGSGALFSSRHRAPVARRRALHQHPGGARQPCPLRLCLGDFPAPGAPDWQISAISGVAAASTPRLTPSLACATP